MEQDEKDDEDQLFDLLYQNCTSLYQNEFLPDSPYFLMPGSPACKILKDILIECKFNHKKFAKKASKIVLFYKYEKETERLKYESTLSENFEILSAIDELSSYENETTIAKVKLIKSQTVLGSISAELKIQNETIMIKEGQEFECKIELSESMIITFLLDNQQEKVFLGDTKIVFRKILEDVTYLNAARLKEIEGVVNKKGKDFEVFVQILLVLSKNNRIKILKKLKDINQHALNEEKSGTIIYEELLYSLGLQDSPVFTSLLKSPKKRHSCCEQCVIT